MPLKKHIEKWLLSEKTRKSKKYVHFDIKPDLSIGVNTATTRTTQDPQIFFEDFFNPNTVAKRGFWPFIHFIKETRRYKKNPKDKFKIGGKVKDVGFIPKKRPIHFASYFDSYIYSFYNQLVLAQYDSYIASQGFSESVLAYRHIDRAGGLGGKNNIHFAKEVFEEIDKIKNCHVYAFDISSFFDNLDWDILEENISKVLGVSALSDDWKNVLRSVSQFSFIESLDIQKYKLIEKIGEKKRISTKRFHKKRKEISATGSKLINKNPKSSTSQGIAQGTPISGTLANIYMIDFDEAIKTYAQSLGGSYYRYSDDILLIIPSTEADTSFNESAKFKVLDEIGHIKLDIQGKKTDIYTFQKGKLIASFSYDADHKDFLEDKPAEPLQYLGFIYDGCKVLLRNKTLSIHNYRMNQTIKKHARLKETPWRPSRVKGTGGIKLRKLNKRFSHLGAKGSSKRYGNFYGYMLKANEIMGDFQQKIGAGKNRIKKQMKNYPKNYEKATQILT